MKQAIDLQGVNLLVAAVKELLQFNIYRNHSA